jgi:hypothetical protein
MSGPGDITPPAAEPAEPRRWSPRAVAENAATVMIVAGVVMLMQPFSLTLYGYSFIVTLAGTVLFMVGSKLPE